MTGIHLIRSICDTAYTCYTSDMARTPEQRRAADRELSYRRREQRAAYDKAYRSSPTYQKRFDPYKRRARKILTESVRKGKTVKPKECSQCGFECVPHGHHEDYSKPLEVIWLCAICHGLRHRKD